MDWRAGPDIRHHGRAADFCPKQSRISCYENVSRVSRGRIYSWCDVHFIMLVYKRGAHEAHRGVLLWDVRGYCGFTAIRCRFANAGQKGWIIRVAVDFSRCGLGLFSFSFSFFFFLGSFGKISYVKVFVLIKKILTIFFVY